ncbi:hypothetical protein [Roseomonas sp. BN140053]|uniref:hypothetical protein n=1 Tax=Roseomonas sp. BN140053 TaxID=3391898 RepID=UPI0039EB287D
MSAPPSRPAVCICLAGEMRNFTECHGWIEALRATAEVSVVVATTNRRGAKFTGPMTPGRLRGVLPPEAARALPPAWQSQVFFERFPELRRILERRAGEQRVTADEIRAVLGPAVIRLENPLPFAWFEHRTRNTDGSPGGPEPFTLRYFHKVFEANLLKRNLEDERGAPFDVVVHIRPDKGLASFDAAGFLARPAGTLLLDSVAPNHAGDQIAVGSSRALDHYAAFFHEACRAADAGQWRGLHGHLREWLVSGGLLLDHLPQQRLIEPDKLLTLEELTAALAAAEGDPLAAGTALALGAEGRRLAGDLAGAVERCLPVVLRAPLGEAVGATVVLGRALEGAGRRASACLCGMLAVAGMPPDSRVWRAVGLSSEEMNLLIENLAPFAEPDWPPARIVASVTAAARAEGEAAAPLAELAGRHGAELAEATRALLDGGITNMSLQHYLSHQIFLRGCPEPAARIAARAAASQPDDAGLQDWAALLRSHAEAARAS